ncbi:MAG: hypothetical protein HXX17_03140 [Geobacteraceae bacterium]|nr:hypothetical protein [Geobacteraceae bacterium]
MQKTFALTCFYLFLLLSSPVTALASEGPAWIYFIMAPFALFSIPFFMTAVFVSIAVYFYWQYKTVKKKSHGIVAVLLLLLAIPVAVRDKQSYVLMKIDRENREHIQQLSKQRREARRQGKHVRRDFTAMSSAAVAKYQATAKTETDRLNYQASRDLIEMARTIDGMQQKEPIPVDTGKEEDKPPVRSVKTLFFELYAVALLAVTLFAGGFIDRWRRRRKLNPPWHLIPLFVCIYAPVLAQLPFIDILMGVQGPRVYFSWFAFLAFSPLPYIVLYLSGVLLYSWRSARIKNPQDEQHPEKEPERELIPQSPLPVHQAADAVTSFACPECRLAGKIATEKLPEQGLLATCPKCKTSFPIGHNAASSSLSAIVKSVDSDTSALKELVLPKADSEISTRSEEFDQLINGKQLLRMKATCLSYFLLQGLAIYFAWQHGQGGVSAPIIIVQLFVFALPSLLAFGCVMAMRKFLGIVALATGVIFAITTAIAVYCFQGEANKWFPLKNLVFDSAFKYALLALASGLVGVSAGCFLAAVERRYGFAPQELFRATFRRLRENSFLIAGWSLFVLIEGIMIPQFHGEAGLIVLPIVVVVDNLPFFIVWMLARVTSTEEVPSARLASILFVGVYALMTLPLHSSTMVLNPVAFMFQITPFIGLAVMVFVMIFLSFFRTRTTVGEPELKGVVSLLPVGSYVYTVRSAALGVAILAACYGSFNGSRERFDLGNLFAAQVYPEIVFTDLAGKPLGHLPVSVEFIRHEPISLLNIHAEQGGRFTLETNKNGILQLPIRKPRLTTLGIAGLFAGKRSIFLSVLDPRWQVPDSVYSPAYELRDMETRQTITCKPADIRANIMRGTHLINLMPAKTWEDVVAELENSAGSLKNLKPEQLLSLASPCDQFISFTCDRIDAALLDHPETPELIRKKTIDNFKVFTLVARSGNYAEPILAALEQDTGISSWIEVLRKEIIIEAQVKGTASKPDGRTAAAIHEEALKLHHQKKYAEAFARYQPVFTSPGPMLARYYANASYACNDLGMPFWSMRLARQGLQLDQRHNRSADSYAQRASYLGKHEAAKFWARVSIDNGFKDDFEYKLLGAASMETGDRLTSAACFVRPMKYNKSETWIMPYLEKIGPRSFWQPIPNI